MERRCKRCTLYGTKRHQPSLYTVATRRLSLKNPNHPSYPVRLRTLMQTFNNNVLGTGRYVHGPVPGTHSLDANGSLSMGDDATDTVDNVRGNGNPIPGAKQIPSSMPTGPGNPAPAFLSAHVALDSAPHHSAGFHFNAQPPAMYADQPQIAQHAGESPGGASAMSPLAIQSIMNPEGTSQPQQIALQAPDASPQNIFMHVVPHVQGSHPGYFSAQDGQPAPTGMQPMAPTMVPAHLVQSMMPLVNGSAAMNMPGMPLAAGTNGAVPMHTGLQASIPTMHAVGAPLHGSFPQADLVDCAVAVDHGGDLQLHQQPPMVSEPPSMDPTAPNATPSVLLGGNASSGLRLGSSTAKRARQRTAPAAPSRAGSAGQHSPRDPRVGTEVSGARSGGGGGAGTAGEEEESVVEKRLKQNREAARRSRDRKRRLKEELRSRIPVLQEEHNCLSNQVQQLMKHLWSSKEGLLSPPMQELMLHQSIYLERCAALKKILETSEDGPLEAGLHDVDCAWGELNAAFDSIKTTYELFLVLNSANAPPTHNMWFHLGGMKLSCVVRTFMQLPVVSTVDAHASATLARLVEGWTFHETLLEHGKKVLQRGLLEACVQVSSQTDAEQGFSVSSRIDGFLDTLTELVSSAFALRRHIMSTLRRNLSSRCYALLLIIQVELLDAHAFSRTLRGSQGLSSEADRAGDDSAAD